MKNGIPMPTHLSLSLSITPRYHTILLTCSLLEKSSSQPHCSNNSHTTHRHHSARRSTRIRRHRRRAGHSHRRRARYCHRRRAGHRSHTTRTRRRRNRQRSHCLQQFGRSRIRHSIAKERKRRTRKRKLRHCRRAGKCGALLRWSLWLEGCAVEWGKGVQDTVFFIVLVLELFFLGKV
jgi:hypothetical protein